MKVLPLCVRVGPWLLPLPIAIIMAVGVLTLIGLLVRELALMSTLALTLAIVSLAAGVCALAVWSILEVSRDADEG